MAVYVKETRMKLKLAAAALALGLASAAAAGPYHRHYHHQHRHSGHWVAPLVGGVVLGALINEAQRPVLVQTIPPVYAQPQVMVQPQVTVQTIPPAVEPNNCLVSIRNPYTGITENLIIPCTKIQ